MFLSAQNYVDALRYSQLFPTGTARNVSMGGAMGIFGADMSSTFTNPAGLGVYRKSEFTVTPAYNYSSFKADYYSTNSQDFINKVSLDNIGFVSTYNNKSNGLVGFSFGLTYNRLKDFNSNVVISGLNQYSSLADYFLSYANGTSPDYLDGYWEWLAYEGGIIELDTTLPGDQYVTPVLLPVSQRRTLTTKGGIGEWDLAFGFNYNNKIYFGGGMGLTRLYYSEVNDHYEYDSQNLNDFNNFTFTQELTTRGTGVNFRLGIIAKPVEYIRIGASIQTPTWYHIEDRFYTTLSSNYISYTATPTDFNGDPLGDLITKYKLITPFKTTGSLGLQFGKLGLLSIEADYMNYASMRLREGYEGYNYYNENSEITDAFRNTVNVRTGGEIRFDKISLRAGFAYLPSPYKKGELNEKSNTMNISGGLGIHDKNFFIDLGTVYVIHDEKYNLYTDPGGSNIADLNISNFRLLTTIGFRF